MKTSTSASLRLWYKSAAADWNEALPVGNGALGAMVYGGEERERLALNEDTFWMGGPHAYDRKGAVEVLPEIRRLLFAGREAEAAALAEARFMGEPKCQTAYQPLGELELDFGRWDGVRYERGLELGTGIAAVRMGAVGGREREREVFVSAPDQVLVMTVRDTRAGDFSFKVSSPFGAELTEETGGGMMWEGRWLNDGVERPWTAEVTEPGLRFAVGVMVKTDGRVVVENGVCRVEGARETVILLAAATSFESYREVGGDAKGKVSARLGAAKGKDLAELRARHVADVAGLMGRVELSLGDGSREGWSTAERLDAVKRGEDDPGLEALFFQYGRYLLVASSRAGTQPANLQGIWNADIAPAWGSKWTTNINLQMNYWHAETANLAECHGPLFDLLDDLRVTGAVTAREYYGARGWVLHHNADVWRGAAPVDGVWGIWPMGAGWLARHAWEHFLFSQDEAFLRERAWPIMREAALFLVDFLVEAPAGTPVAGRLVTCPSHSPENRFVRADGKEGLFTYAATMDLMIVHDLFTSCLAALERMKGDGEGGEDGGLGAIIREKLERLAPLQISAATGRLQEWVEDYEDAEPGHRHVSHAYGLYPGQQITREGTPELVAAVRRMLELRLANGGGGTGWSRAWLISLYARLGDGDGARGHLQALLAKCTLPNLFDTHPPFQIDGNFGAAAGVAEMLLQSRAGEAGGSGAEDDCELELLPALPAAWARGEVTGLRARGGIEVAMSWEGGRLTGCTLRRNDGRAVSVVVVIYRGWRRRLEIEGRNEIVVDGW